MKRKTKPGKAKSTSQDVRITKPDANSETELKEDELKKVSGGLIALLNKPN